MRRGELYNAKGDFAKATAVLQQAQELAPKDRGAGHAPGVCVAEQRAPQRSLGRISAPAATSAGNPYILNNIALLLAETGGDLDQALRLTQKALPKAPEQAFIMDTLRSVYLKKNLTDSAVRTFAGLVHQYPDNPTFHQHLGEALLAKSDHPGAQKEFAMAKANRR